MKLGRTRVAWVCPQLSYSVASTRYRCYYPALALYQFDVDSQFYRSSAEVIPHLADLDAIIFVKLLDGESLKLAGLAKGTGVKVFVDLCDNVVVGNYPKRPDFHPTLRFAGIGAIADAIVVPSPALAQALKPLVRPGVDFVVIPDQVESRDTYEAARTLQIKTTEASRRRRPKLRRRATQFLVHMAHRPIDAISILKRKSTDKLTEIHRFITKFKHANSPAQNTAISQIGTVSSLASADDKSPLQVHPKSVVWFGNYGAPHSDFGMLALLLAGPSLEAVHYDTPLKLTVISNKKALFDTTVAQIGVPTHYVDWSPDAVFNALETADVCLLPFGVDAFSITKSANRAVLALAHGVPVVTSTLSSIEPLSEVVALDDWKAGLRRFLGPHGPSERAAAIAAARTILKDIYSPNAIGKAWATLIEKEAQRLRPGFCEPPSAREIAILLDAPQHIELMLPIIDELRWRENLLLRVLLAPDAIAASTRPMMERQIVPYALEVDTVFFDDDRILRTADCLLTADGYRLDPRNVVAPMGAAALARGVKTFALEPTGDDGTGYRARSLSTPGETATMLFGATAESFVEKLLHDLRKVGILNSSPTAAASGRNLTRRSAPMAVSAHSRPK